MLLSLVEAHYGHESGYKGDMYFEKGQVVLRCLETLLDCKPDDVASSQPRDLFFYCPSHILANSGAGGSYSGHRVAGI